MLEIVLHITINIFKKRYLLLECDLDLPEIWLWIQLLICEIERRLKHLFLILTSIICFPEGKRRAFISCSNKAITTSHSFCVHLIRFVEPYGDAIKIEIYNRSLLHIKKHKGLHI